MDSNIEIRKLVFSSAEFNKVVNRDFMTFTQPIEDVESDTPEELFRLYEKLYYLIDVNGDTNSHEYLVKRSVEIVGFQQTTEEIQPLLDEIGQLRQQLLLANQQILDLETIQ